MTRLLLMLFLAYSIPGAAQEAGKKKKFDEETENTFRFGVKGGVNINKVEGKAFKDAFSYNYVLGAFIQWNFSEKFGLQPEASLSQATSEITSDQTDIYDDLFLGGEQKKSQTELFKDPCFIQP